MQAAGRPVSCSSGSSAFAGGHARRALTQQPASRAARGRGQCSVWAAVRVGSKRSVVKCATLQAEEGQEAAVRQLCVTWQEKMLATKVAGLQTFDIHEDPWTAGVFNVWERWDTVASLSRFGSSAEQQAFEAAVLPLTRNGIGMALYEWQDGKLGVACVPIGPKGEGGLDDAPGAHGGVGGGSSYVQTSKGNAPTHRHDDKKDLFGMSQALEVSKK